MKSSLQNYQVCLIKELNNAIEMIYRFEAEKNCLIIFKHPTSFYEFRMSAAFLQQSINKFENAQQNQQISMLS